MTDQYGIPAGASGYIERVEIAQTANAGGYNHEVHWSSVLELDPKELEQKIKDGWLDTLEWDGTVEVEAAAGRILLGPSKNLVVTQGFVRVQNLGWAIGGALQAVNCMGLDNGTANPTATDTTVLSTGGATSVRIQAFDSAATQSAAGVVSQTSTFTQATVSFVMKRLSLNFIAAGSLPIITTGTVPATSLHSCTNVFTIDLTSFTTWSQALTATITGSGT